MAAQPALISPEEYLRREDEAEFGSEYVDGFAYAMGGTSFDHDQIVGNLSGLLYRSLRGSSCRHYDHGVKVWISEARSYYYPDLLILCPGGEFLSRLPTIADKPKVVFEVLSEGTASLDEGQKFAAYRTLESMQDYVLVDSRKMAMRVFSREQDEWVVGTYANSDVEALVPSVGVRLVLRDVYESVAFRSDPG